MSLTSHVFKIHTFTLEATLDAVDNFTSSVNRGQKTVLDMEISLENYSDELFNKLSSLINIRIKFNLNVGKECKIYLIKNNNPRPTVEINGRSVLLEMAVYE